MNFVGGKDAQDCFIVTLTLDMENAIVLDVEEKSIWC